MTTRDAKRAATAQRILEAAQEEFALHGFEGATIRSIAGRAGVHASLVMQHYGSKAALFAIAVQLPEDDHEATSDHLFDVLDVRMGELPPETRALVRSMLTVPEAEASMREFLGERVENLKGSIGGDDAELRAALVVSGILGFTIARHFLKLQAFENISRESLVKAAHSWVTAVSNVQPSVDMTTASCQAGDMTDTKKHEETLSRIREVRERAIEHTRRARVLAVERRDLMQTLIDDGWSQSDIARELGLSRQAIQKMLAL